MNIIGPAGTLRSVQVGRVAPLGPRGVPSAFVKRPVAGPVTVETLGLAGDEQADLRVHGGPDKAVYGYAYSNYAIWAKEYPQHAALLVPGAFGENLTMDACDEETVFIRDVVSIGTAVLQVTEPRQPCFKFALRFGEAAIVRAMVQNGLCGWYYRVLKAGSFKSGDTLSLLERPNPSWPVQRMNRQIAQRHGSEAEREEFRTLMSHT